MFALSKSNGKALLLEYSMLAGFPTLALGDHHSLILKQDSSVWSVGFNKHGQLGDGSTRNSFGFVSAVKAGAKAVAAGSDHSMILKHDGSVWATGQNEYGQLGYGSKPDRSRWNTRWWGGGGAA